MYKLYVGKNKPTNVKFFCNDINWAKTMIDMCPSITHISIDNHCLELLLHLHKQSKIYKDYKIPYIEYTEKIVISMIEIIRNKLIEEEKYGR